MSEINDMIKESVVSIKEMLTADSVVGAPITDGNCTVIPVSKLSCGLVSGGYDMKTKQVKLLPATADSELVAVIGGGITAHPIGFVIISDGEVSFIKTEGDNVNKWLEIVQNTIKSALKR